jgi:hypothetical protein
MTGYNVSQDSVLLKCWIQTIFGENGDCNEPPHIPPVVHIITVQIQY